MAFRMKVTFRVDASLLIGSGHVMRCLTLADALKAKGAQCQFICRAHPGNLIKYIQDKGFRVHELAAPDTYRGTRHCKVDYLPMHADWLGVPWQQDAEECQRIIEPGSADWLIVDHYSLDSCWEQQLADSYSQLLVIDDLADRSHRCDFLLDQNLGRCKEDYLSLVPQHCQVFSGANYALLRPEFAQWREASLTRRTVPELKKILISMGGVDLPNATGRVLDVLKKSALSSDCQISVIMGATAPWLADVKMKAASMPWVTEVVVSVDDMAKRMALSDLAIGAAGSTSWERCCLGLPTLMVTLAQNQLAGASALQDAGAALLVGDVNDIENNLEQLIKLAGLKSKLKCMSEAASKLCDGGGSTAIVDYIGHLNG